MRRTERGIKRLRLRIIELRKGGKNYEEIRKKTGASPNTIAKVLKNFKDRYCQKCGETNPEVLEEHHPDKENRPEYTVTLCANCHEEITRKQIRERNTKKKELQDSLSSQPGLVLPEKSDESRNLSAPAYGLSHLPATTEDIKAVCFIAGGIGCIEEFMNPERKHLEKILFLTDDVICLW